jgi:HD-GYP domain-containing protein (c-di-GMP phosphodiesterase class II)
MTKDSDNLQQCLRWLDAICGAHAALVLPELYTFKHQVLTTPLVHGLGTAMGLSASENRLLQIAARMHDIGKLGLLPLLHETRYRVLDRASLEFMQIKQHTVLGDIFFRALLAYVGHAELLEPMAMVCRWHHERVDGTGYPDQLRGTQIPMMVRIVSVLDSLSAMTGPERPWQNSLTLVQARQELLRVRGSQLDENVVNALEHLFQTANGHEVHHDG